MIDHDITLFYLMNLTYDASAITKRNKYVWMDRFFINQSVNRASLTNQSFSRSIDQSINQKQILMYLLTRLIHLSWHLVQLVLRLDKCIAVRRGHQREQCQYVYHIHAMLVSNMSNNLFSCTLWLMRGDETKRTTNQTINSNKQMQWTRS